MKNILKKIGEFLLKKDISDLKQQLNELIEAQESLKKEVLKLSGNLDSYNDKIYTHSQKIDSALKAMLFNKEDNENIEYFSDYFKNLIKKIEQNNFEIQSEEKPNIIRSKHADEFHSIIERSKEFESKVSKYLTVVDDNIKIDNNVADKFKDIMCNSDLNSKITELLKTKNEFR